MHLPKNLFNRERPQQAITLDHTEILLLKEVTCFMKSKEYSGSQLEALLEGRGASRASKTSTLTPSPESKADAEPQPQVPSQADSAANATPHPSSFVHLGVLDPAPETAIEPPSASSTPTCPSVLEDHDFEDHETDGTDSYGDSSSLKKDARYFHVEDHSFAKSKNKNTLIYNNSFLGNDGCFNNSNNTSVHMN